MLPDSTDTSRATIDALYVDPDYHRRGIGSLLLHSMLTSVKHEMAQLAVTRWAPAVAFYEAQGFALVDRPLPVPEPPQAYGITLEQVSMERQNPLTFLPRVKI